MKVSEIVRKAKKQGCVIRKHGGDHDLWNNPKTGQSALIPRHWSKELPDGTANNILRKLGLK